ncbi:MAG: PqqD family protein [Pseudomonadota bacterium]|nr:PqqD family protein [Pseudomonadota bacterium]
MVSTKDLQRKLVVSPEVMFQEVGGEVVLLDLASESYFGLDEVGARAWALLNEQGDLQAVYEAMLAEYDVEPDRLAADLADLAERLLEAGLVREG